MHKAHNKDWFYRINKRTKFLVKLSLNKQNARLGKKLEIVELLVKI